MRLQLSKYDRKVIRSYSIKCNYVTSLPTGSLLCVVEIITDYTEDILKSIFA
jgi:hypothetical protein